MDMGGMLQFFGNFLLGGSEDIGDESLYVHRKS